MKVTPIIEAREKVTMSDFEKRWHKKLIKLLTDDGKGHHHKAYADRLKDFALNIIPADEDPMFTASMDFDNAIIRINSGFLSDEASFEQLSVLMRHEMAHALMLHQVRMMHKIVKKYTNQGYSRIKMSMSLHELENIIADFEISNKRYTPEDKETVKNMWLNGRTIGGLVTEEHRNWQDLSLEEMDDKIQEEIAKINADLLSEWDYDPEHHIDARKRDKYNNIEYNNYGEEIPDQIKYSIAKAYKHYTDTKAQTNFLGSLEKFVNKQGLYHFFPLDDPQKGPAIFRIDSLPEEWQNIIKVIYNQIYNSGMTKQKVRDEILKIAKTSPNEKIDLQNPETGEVLDTLYTPEEKLLATDALKACLPTLEQYQTWYDKVVKVLSDQKYSKQDIEKIINDLQGGN